MINTLFDAQPEIFGLFELSDAGTILYSRSIGGDRGSSEILTETTGRNFFDEAAPFENIEEFRRHLNHFIKSDFPSKSFNFDCRIKDLIVPVKIMLVRVNERSSAERAKTTIVDIRKV